MNPETMLCGYCTWHRKDGHEPLWFEPEDEFMKGWWCHNG